MIYNGTPLKNKMAIQEHKLYKITANCPEFELDEKGSKHRVNMVYKFAEAEYGLFGMEYKPEFLYKYVKDIGKAVDIMAVVMNEDQLKVASYLYDIKETFNGSDVISHGLEQIRASLRHEKALIDPYCGHFKRKRKVGIITGEFKKDRIKKKIQDLESDLKKDNTNVPAMVVKKVASVNIAQKEELRMLQNVLDNKVEFEDESYHLDIILSDKLSDGTYHCEFIVQN